MILAAALNPAIDVTLAADGGTVARRAGGKAVNVAHVLADLGHAVRVVGISAGPTGSCLRDGLTAHGLEHEWVSVAGRTRTTYTTWSTDGHAVTTSEKGPTIADRDWLRAVRLVCNGRSDVAVLSGSLPAGAPTDGYVSLIRGLAGRGTRIVLDTSGDPLRESLAAGPDVVTPNRAELEFVAGRELCSPADAAAAAEELRRRGARAVIATLDEDGLVGVGDEGVWHVLSRPRRGNPTGAGDACVAGLAAAMVERRPWSDQLRLAAALGALAVDHEVAGVADVARVAAEVDATTVVRL